MESDSKRRLKRWGGAALTLVLLAAVAWLASRQLNEMDWSAVSAALASYSPATISLALLAALVGYLAVSQYDLIGRYYTGHTLSVPRVLIISFIGYTFSLNLGALVGGLGFRYRLYSKANLSTATTTRVIGLSILGNWSGYVLLAGLLFALAPPQLPDHWGLGQALLRVLGAALLLTTAAYIGLCWRRAGRVFSVGSHTLEVPGLSVAGIQFALSLLSWCAMASIIHVLLPDDVSWFMVLAAVLTSSIAAALSHVPGGIGVLEVVFIALLGHVAPDSSIVAALLAYRCIYYMLPLLLAVVLYIVLEIAHARATPATRSKQRETA